MSWHHSPVISVGQCVVTQLSELLGCRLNMNVLFVGSSGLSIHLCKGILCLYWSANWEILLCLFQPYQLIVQHLEWLITTQDIVMVLILVFLQLENMSKSLFHRWLLNPHSWHVFIRPRGILQTLKWGSWLEEHVGVMLSSMLCPNTGLIWFTKALKHSLDWWCRLLVGRCYWMRSTTLSCLLILGLKRCMICCLLVCSGHRWEFLVSEFVSNVCWRTPRRATLASRLFVLCCGLIPIGHGLSFTCFGRVLKGLLVFGAAERITLPLELFATTIRLV